MLGLATKPEEFSGFAPMTKLKQGETKECTNHKAMAENGVHPIHKAGEQEKPHNKKYDCADLGQVHALTLPQIPVISRGGVALC